MTATTIRATGKPAAGRNGSRNRLAHTRPLEYVVPAEFTASLQSLTVRELVSLLSNIAFTVNLQQGMMPKESELKTIAILEHLGTRIEEARNNGLLKIMLESRLAQSGVTRTVSDAAQSLISEINK